MLYLIVVEDDPAAELGVQHVANVVSGVRRRSHVRYEG
jgi:hypothetical protein